MKKKWHILLSLVFCIPLLTLPAYHAGDKPLYRPEETGILMQSGENLLADTWRGICYSGYRTGQHPDRGEGAVNPSREEILEDLKILTYKNNFRLIRLYDSGTNTEMVLQLIRENNIDMKVLLGIWLKAEKSNHEGCPWLNEPIADSILQQNKIINQEEIQRGIRLANEYKEIVIAVNAGNEALVEWNDHMVETDTVITYVRKIQRDISQPVTVAENYKWWSTRGAALSRVVDFAAVHIYPVWEGKAIEEGLSFSIENMKEVAEALPGVPLVITEAGWATRASEFGERAGEKEQKRYYKEIMDWSREMNITTFFFEAFDEEWKGDPGNPLGAEKHWGLFTANRRPKLIMSEFYRDFTGFN